MVYKILFGSMFEQGDGESVGLICRYYICHFFIDVLIKYHLSLLNYRFMRSVLLVACLLFGFVTLGSTFNMYNLISISNSTGASCLDGSPFGYYVWYPDQYEPRQNKLLIYFEETPFGWCLKEDLNTTLEECYKFTIEDNLIDFGSSGNWSESEMFLTGILSPFEGGEFNSWTKVLVKSCDGGLFMGDGNTVEYKKHKLYFKGSLNIQEMLLSLQTRGYLQVEEVVIAGSMNGAIAAMMWSEKLKEYTDAPVRILADSAIHLNEYNRKNSRYEYQSRMKMFAKIALQNGDALPNKKCAAAHKNDPQQCLFALELSNYTDSPIFYTQSLYDGWSINFVLGYACAQDFGSLSQCTEKEQEVIIEYHKNITEVIKGLEEKGKSKNIGLFSIACVSHEFLHIRYDNELFEVPMESGNKATTVISEWIRKDEGSVSYIDSVEWPDNIPCARKPK